MIMKKQYAAPEVEMIRFESVLARTEEAGDDNEIEMGGENEDIFASLEG